MILTDYFYPEHDVTWDYAVQCGVQYGDIRLPETPDFCLTDPSHWQTLCDRFRSRGITPLLIEPLPNCLHDHIKTGDSRRDESIETFIRMLPLMQKQGIQTVCFNFMAYVGWTRTTGAFPVRGGALSTAFDLEDYVPSPSQSSSSQSSSPSLSSSPSPSEATISEESLWRNYQIFVDSVVPEAEKYDIRLALHPDDPPLPRLGNVSRIMISLANIQKALAVHPSPCLGVTFCQACYYAMGEDPAACARALGDSIFFVHFRNITGSAQKFHETFHDNGSIPMARMIALYRDLGLNVPIRVDHVPLMGDPSAPDFTSLPAGYSATSRLYAIGYLKGLLEMYDAQNPSASL